MRETRVRGKLGDPAFFDASGTTDSRAGGCAIDSSSEVRSISSTSSPIALESSSLGVGSSELTGVVSSVGKGDDSASGERADRDLLCFRFNLVDFFVLVVLALKFLVFVESGGESGGNSHFVTTGVFLSRSTFVNMVIVRLLGDNYIPYYRLAWKLALVWPVP